MQSGKPTAGSWDVYALVPPLPVRSCVNLGAFLQSLRETGCQKVILPENAFMGPGAQEAVLSGDFVLNVVSPHSFKAVQKACIAGFYLDTVGAANPGLIEETSSRKLPTYLTINALNGRHLDEILCKYAPGTLVLLWEGHDSPDGDPTQEFLSLCQLLKLRQLYSLPLAYLSPLNRSNAVLAFALGAGTVIGALDASVVLDKEGGRGQALTLMEAFIKQVQKLRSGWQSDSCVPPTSPEDWDNMEARMDGLVAARLIHKGEVLQQDMVVARPPHHGIRPSLLTQLIGCKFKYDVQPGEAVTFGLLELQSVLKLTQRNS